MKLGFLVSVSLLGLIGCAHNSQNQIGDRTKVAAAAGGAVGAGLGAIIGSQTGNAAGGVVLGALAGTATAGYVAHSVEQQDITLKAQDQAIARQQGVIDAQSQELRQLRDSSLDSRARLNPSQVNARMDSRLSRLYARARPYREGDPLPPGLSAKERALFQGNSASYRREEIPVVRSRHIEVIKPRESAVRREKKTPVSAHTEQPPILPAAKITSTTPEMALPKVESREVAVPVKAPAVADAPKIVTKSGLAEKDLVPAEDWGALNPSQKTSTDECGTAEAESVSAMSATDPADKLFHLRRALRLCPKSSDYRMKLADVYLSMNRKGDAIGELKEALSINPQDAALKDKLTSLEQ